MLHIFACVFLLQFPLLPITDLEKQHQKWELGWLHIQLLPAKAQMKQKMWTSISVEIGAWEASERLWGLRSAIGFLLNGSTVKNQYGTF